MPNPRVARMVRDDRAQIDRGWTAGIDTSELVVDVGAHFVATPTDRGAKVNAELSGGTPSRYQRLDASLDDATGRATPTGMQKGNSARRMRNEDRHAVSDRDRHPGSPLDGKVPIGFLNSEPSLPIRGVCDDARTVNLGGSGEARAAGTQLAAERRPTGHDVAHRLVGHGAEASEGASRRECADTEGGELRDGFDVRSRNHFDRRSSTRSIRAPSARKRSSIRS
jgi:hypothetical protein